VPVTVGTFESTLSLLRLISDWFFPVSDPFFASLRAPSDAAQSPLIPAVPHCAWSGCKPNGILTD
jgi:hypothetical protein